MPAKVEPFTTAGAAVGSALQGAAKAARPLEEQEWRWQTFGSATDHRGQRVDTYSLVTAHSGAQVVLTASQVRDGQPVLRTRNPESGVLAVVSGQEAAMRLIAKAPDLLRTLKGTCCFGCGVKYGAADRGARNCITCRTPRALIAQIEAEQ
jgi:hypothetical protein